MIHALVFDMVGGIDYDLELFFHLMPVEQETEHFCYIQELNEFFIFFFKYVPRIRENGKQKY